MSLSPAAEGHGNIWRVAARGGALLLLFPFEIIGLDLFYDVRAIGAGGADWLNINAVVKFVAYAGLYALLAFAMLVWPQRRALLGEWAGAAGPHPWRGALIANIALFLALAFAAALMSAARGSAPWGAFAAWAGGVGVMALLLAYTLAPVSYWRAALTRHARDIAWAGAAGVLIAGASWLAQDSWNLLADATLNTSYLLLSAVEPDAHIAPAYRLIGVGDFDVIIDSYCSGYEGVGLVLAALALYLIVFRNNLRFPNAWLLLPLGGAAVWTLNAVRIAALVLLGAHVSPDLALHGFHSQAGWIAFVAVTVGIMALAQAAPFFRADAVKRAADPAVLLAASLIAPFAALMVARIVAALFGPSAHWAGPLAMLAPAAALIAFRATIRAQLGRVRLEDVAVGLVVGAIWIATEPAKTNAPLGAWLAAQTPLDSTLWLALRIAGFALIVPIAEELAFRGYLYRALAARRFEEAAPGAFSWTALIATSVLFGAMHGRWLAGALAGAAYGLVLVRSKSVSGPIAAHIASNGVIAAYAVATASWGLL